MGLLLVNTGEGKGKTTAALGLALRNVGHGGRVLFLQFIKGDDAAGEYRAAEALAPLLTIRRTGLGFVPKPSAPGFERHKAAAESALAEAGAAIRSGDYALVVLDELNYAVHFGLLDIRDVLPVLSERPDGTNVMVTGRYAKDELLRLADTVTEMGAVKHHYDSGVPATKGVEF